MANSIDSSILNGLGIAAGSTNAAAAAAGSSAGKLGQADFMKLMITQLRNQDPFKPMDSGQFLGQLAQFGTVSGIDAVKTSLDGVASSLGANQSLQAAALVNRNVLVPAREAWLPPGGQVAGALDLPAGTTGASVGVYDLSGSLLATVPVDASQGGRTPFSWDGTLADGTKATPGFYELRPTADVAGKSTALDALVSGRVESVNLAGGTAGSIGLTVTGLGVVDFGQVRGISS